jgi:hypothetical protein
MLRLISLDRPVLPLSNYPSAFLTEPLKWNGSSDRIGTGGKLN